VLISDKVVSGLVYIADATSYLYVQEPDRSAGIRVLWDDFTGLSNGCIVDVSGSLTTIDGERVIQASSVTATGLTTTVDPLLITLSDIGGGAAGFQPGVVLRIPTLPNDPLGLNAAGVNNVGLLVQIYGKVTAVESFGGLDDVYFYVDDGSDIYVNPDPEDPDTVDDNVGSDLWDGEHYGVGVSPYALFGYPAYPNVSEGDFVKVVGMVSTRIDSEGRVLPFLRIRGESDVDQYLSTEMLTSPADRVFPETGGSGAVWNLASLPLPIAFDGTQNPPQYPPQAFKIMGDGYLWSWSAINQAGIQLYADSQAPDACLNHVRRAAGYWFRMTEANNIDYKAVSDDITDRWVSIPYTEFNLFGHPLNHEMAWKDLCITDGKRMGGITEAARDLNWVSSIGYWWQNSAQSLQDIGLPDDSTSSEILKSWYGYYMYTYKPVSLIVPGPALLIAPRGSILATVTDGTNPIIGARVYCKYGSAITTSPDGTALIENLLPGDYLVTACATGYVSQSNTVTVTAGVQSSESFALTEYSVITVGVGANPGRIPPDGVSTSTLTVHVADLEGVPLGNKEVNLSTDAGALNASLVTTNEFGKAEVTLTSSTTPDTATVTATCDGAVGRGYVEFANPGDPTVRIESPEEGTLISGDLIVTITARDVGGIQYVGVYEVRLHIDGADWGLAAETDTRGIFKKRVNSMRLTNGAHELRAVAKDMEQNLGYSQQVNITSANVVSDLTMTPPEIFIDGSPDQLFRVSGQYTGDAVWHVEVRDYDGGVIAASEGGAGSILLEWDGKIEGSYAEGVYKLRIFETGGSGGGSAGQGGSSFLDWLFPLPICVTRQWGDALIAGLWHDPESGEWSEESAIREMYAVWQACQDWGLTCTLVADPLWYNDTDPRYHGVYRVGLRDRLVQWYSVFFITTHGNRWFEWQDGYLPITWFDCDCHVGSLRDLPEVPEAMKNAKDAKGRPMFPFVSDCGLQDSGQYKVVMLNSCWSGYREDMAIAFGMDSLSNHENMDQTYCGWSSPYWPVWPWNGADCTETFWYWLGQGATVAQADYNTCLFPSECAMCLFFTTYGYPYTTWLPW